MSLRSVAIGTVIGLSLSTTAYAAMCPESPGAKETLTWKPISHFVEKVLERADTGIAHAQAEPGIAAVFDTTAFQWIADVAAAVLVMIDTEMRQVEYARDLEENTACLHVDLRIMEAKMEQVRCELRDAVRRGSMTGIFRLQSLLGFLNGRYRALTLGATDPEFEDVRWQFWHYFDAPDMTICCNNFTLECTKMDALECESNGFTEVYPTVDKCLAGGTCFMVAEELAAEEEEDPLFPKLCPFHSDYWVPTVLLMEDDGEDEQDPADDGVKAKAYGCDLDALEEKGHHEEDSTATAEYEALKAFVGERDELLATEGLQHIKDAYETIQEFAGKEIDPNIAYFGRTVDAEHDRVFDCDPKLPPNAVFLDLRGPFSYQKDHTSILKEYFNLTQKWALRRNFGDAYKLPSEIESAEDRKEAEDREKEGLQSLGIIRMLRTAFREGAEDDALRQATAETTILPKSSDMQYVIFEKMKPLRKAMKGLYDNVTSASSGFRGFSRGFAFFLRASCIYRPCSERLDQILKILFTDSCFPYATGDYTKKPNPAYFDCLDEVGDEAYCEAVYGKFLEGASWRTCRDEVLQQ